jgi:hypothetical protein
MGMKLKENQDIQQWDKVGMDTDWMQLADKMNQLGTEDTVLPSALHLHQALACKLQQTNEQTVVTVCILESSGM